MDMLEQKSVLSQLEKYIESLIPKNEIDNIDYDNAEKILNDETVLSAIEACFQDKKEVKYDYILSLTDNIILINMIENYLIEHDKMKKESEENEMIILDAICTEDTVKDYLRSIGSYPLFTPEEELEVFLKLQDIKLKIEKSPERKIEFEEIEELFDKGKINENDLKNKKEKIYNKDSEYINLKNKITERNLRLVASIAKKYTGRGILFLDLIQDGSFGLMTAVDKFDPAKGYKFSTYATWWIRQAITREIANTSRTIRIPVHLDDEMKKYKSINSEIQTERCTDDIDYEEIARRYLETDDEEKILEKAKKIEQVHNASKTPVSLDKAIGEEEDTALGDLVQDNTLIDPQEYLEVEMFIDTLNKLLEKENIKERDKNIFEMRMGINGYKPHKLEEIAKKWDITRERVRQIDRKVKLKIFKPSNKKLFEGYNLEQYRDQNIAIIPINKRIEKERIKVEQPRTNYNNSKNINPNTVIETFVANNVRENNKGKTKTKKRAV